MLRESENVYQEYLKELKGENIPVEDTGMGFKFFKYLRMHIAKKSSKAPFDFKEIRLELHPSIIEGIGVFSARKIRDGD